MPIPTHIVFARPVREALADSPNGLSRIALYDKMAAWANLSEEERAQTIASGQEVYKNRVGWACSWLKISGYVDNPVRGTWRITAAGKARLETSARPFTQRELSGRSSSAGEVQDDGEEQEIDGEGATVITKAQIEAAIEDVHRQLRDDVLSKLVSAKPKFFEQTVLQLLAAMGYGRPEHRGQTGDQGIDGVMYGDPLGLNRVYVQAKKFSDQPVGSNLIRDFSGAMGLQGATMGVLVTTSRFTGREKSLVTRDGKVIRLIDGDELARLMVEKGVGVSTSMTFVVKAIDEDFFDE